MSRRYTQNETVEISFCGAIFLISSISEMDHWNIKKFTGSNA